MTSHLAPLVDGDILIYRCGFAVKEGEPLEYALHTIKRSLENIYDQFPNAPYRKLYLTGANNYREKVAVTKPYKGNRRPDNKPFYYAELRDYFRDYHDAILVEDMEADDALGMEQWKNKDKSTIICTIDKDLRCIPGHHFNFVKGVIDYVPMQEANLNFWTQVLTGDTTDNIVGLPKYGPKAAEKVLAGSDGSWVDLYTRVKREYEKVYDHEAEQKFKEMATLIWILREPFKNFDGTDIFPEEEEDGSEV